MQKVEKQKKHTMQIFLTIDYFFKRKPLDAKYLKLIWREERTRLAKIYIHTMKLNI